MNQEVKALRSRIDYLFTPINDLKPIVLIGVSSRNSEEINESLKALNLSKMWLGKFLGAIGIQTPYPDSKNSSNEKIEPTADTWEGASVSGLLNERYSEFSHVQKVKELRFAIDILARELDFIEQKYLVDFCGNAKAFCALSNAYTYLTEGNLWLGMELGRINRLNGGK